MPMDVTIGMLQRVAATPSSVSSRLSTAKAFFSSPVTAMAREMVLRVPRSQRMGAELLHQLIYGQATALRERLKPLRSVVGETYG